MALTAPIRIAMIAGETSADHLGSRVMEALRQRLGRVEFCGVGGPQMIAAGFDSWFSHEQLTVHGVIEAVRRVGDLFVIRRELLRRLRTHKPHLFVGIDLPDFNLSLARRLKRAGIPTAHLVSPTVWAWRPGRVKTVRRAVSHILVLFPFEEAIYRAAGVPVTYIGHPLADEIPENIARETVRAELRLPAGGPVIALLPGSRQSELERMTEPFILAAKLLAEGIPGVRFLVPLVTRETRERFEEALYRHDARDLPLTLLFGHAQEALAACDVALATSGTVTLEAALIGRPMVIAYRLGLLNYAIGRHLIRVRYIGLPNILCGEWVVPEFVQDDVTPENLTQAVANLLADHWVCGAIERRFGRLRAELARNAADRAADALLPLMTHAPQLATQAA
jgi:lipid-A-disaccharide synthase